MTGALWVLCGVLLFTIIEKIFSSCANADGEGDAQPTQEDSEGSSEPSDMQVGAQKSGNQTIKIAGYLNLMANSIDNFTQGLAVAASFLVSFRQGLLGTIAILCELNFYTVGIKFKRISMDNIMIPNSHLYSAWDSTRGGRFCHSIAIWF